MRGTLDALRQSLPQLIRVAAEKVQSQFVWRVDGSVYQYTHFKTLREMLGGPIIKPPDVAKPMSELWATSSVHLNDTNEFDRGREVVEAVLSELPDDKITSRMRLAVRDADALEVYCTSFSGVDDDLSQWRGYGGDGSGVCLEFDLGRLIAGLDGVGYWLIYGKPGNEATQRAVAKELVRYIHASIQTALPSPTVPGAVFNEVREQLREIWPALFLAFKHLDFSAEQEFRFVYSAAVGGRRTPAFRPDPLVPFVPLRMRPSGPLPIKGIRLGPAVGSSANIRSLELALRELKLSHVTVSRSDIPYLPR